MKLKFTCIVTIMITLQGMDTRLELSEIQHTSHDDELVQKIIKVIKVSCPNLIDTTNNAQYKTRYKDLACKKVIDLIASSMMDVRLSRSSLYETILMQNCSVFLDTITADQNQNISLSNNVLRQNLTQLIKRVKANIDYYNNNYKPMLKSRKRFYNKSDYYCKLIIGYGLFFGGLVLVSYISALAHSHSPEKLCEKENPSG